MDIWLPESSRDTKQVKFQCRICNHRFQTFRVYEDHVIRCSKEHENELHEYGAWYVETHREPDPEWADYNLGLIKQGIDPDVQFSRGRKTNIRRASES